MSRNTKRQEFIGNHSIVSDDDFALALGVKGDLKRFALAARQALGRVCEVPPERIHSTDSPAQLIKLASDWDLFQIVIALEEILGVPVKGEIPAPIGWRLFWWGESGCSTIGEWTIRIAHHLQTILTETRNA